MKLLLLEPTPMVCRFLINAYNWLKIFVRKIAPSLQQENDVQRYFASSQGTTSLIVKLKKINGLNDLRFIRLYRLKHFLDLFSVLQIIVLYVVLY